MKFGPIIMCLLAIVPAICAETPSINGLDWRDNGTATAKIENWPLERVLQSLSDQGRWQILVEPDLNLNVTTRFTDIPHTKALRRLLSDVNFAIIPFSKSPSRLLVYKTSSAKAIVPIVPTKRLSKSEAPTIKPGAIPNELVVTLKPNSSIDIEAEGNSS